MSQDWKVYNFGNVCSIIRHREIGIWLKNKHRRRRKTSNSDSEILKSLYCNKHSYLETIACRKIQRHKAPSYCHGRLFTENYHAWFNLFTGPTSGPRLMCSDILKTERIETGSKIVILDAVAVLPPNSVSLLGTEKLCRRHLIMLSKKGWLYQVNLVTGEILQKIFIPTKFDASDVRDSNSMELNESNCCSNFVFKYRHLSANKESESIVVKSTQLNAHNTSAVAVCLLGVYPLRLISHFMITATSANATARTVKTNIVNDLLLVFTMKGSMIYFYDLNQVTEYYKYENTVFLQQSVKIHSWNEVYTVGDSHVGIPYTSKQVNLSSSDLPIKEIPCLFKTSAVKHSLQIGAVPYHYLVPSNRTGTSWVVRDIITNKEVLSGHLEVEEKWDMSHWHDVSFTADSTGRMIKQNLTTVDVLYLKQESPGNQHNEDKNRWSLHVGFTIDISPMQHAPKDSRIKWTYPNMAGEDAYPAHAVTSSGRLVRRPRPLSHVGNNGSADPVRHLLVCVETELYLDLLALLYYRPQGRVRPGWEHEDGGSELALSVFDALDGRWLSTHVLEHDVSPCDRDSLSIMIDEDTIVFTRLPAVDQRIHYKIYRLNRRYGGGDLNINEHFDS